VEGEASHFICISHQILVREVKEVLNQDLIKGSPSLE